MRNAETELLDDIVDILTKYDYVKGMATPIAQDVVELVRDRLLSPDDMGALDDRLSELGGLSVEIQELIGQAQELLPSSVR